jgi:hypothetical protein
MRARFVLLALLLGALVPAFAEAPDYGRAPAPQFELGSHRAGESPAHRLSFSVSAGELETYRARVTYPDGFRFNGFDVVGAIGSQVGALTLDVDGDGAADRTIPLRSLTDGSAYADVIADGRFSAQLEPLLEHAVPGTFVLRLPFGGDANPDTLTVLFDARVTLVLSGGLLTNPAVAGPYLVTAQLTSVDPDTDGPDDGAGAAPARLAFELTVPIEAIGAVPFAALCVAKVAHGDGRKGEAGHWFRVRGRFSPGPASDGTDPRSEPVTVTFAGFQQEIPATALLARGRHRVVFSGAPPGVVRLELGKGHRFVVHAQGLDLGMLDPGEPVTFALQIGNDRGAIPLVLDLRGGRQCAP